LVQLGPRSQRGRQRRGVGAPVHRDHPPAGRGPRRDRGRAEGPRRARDERDPGGIGHSWPLAGSPAGTACSTTTSAGPLSFPSSLGPCPARAAPRLCELSASALAHFSTIISRSSAWCRVYSSQPSSSCPLATV